MLRAKLGLFPFFYWIVVVRMKIGFIRKYICIKFTENLSFLVIMIINKSIFRIIYLLVYLRVFFVIFSLLLVSDLWLLLVYSSIANTGIIILRVYGVNFLLVVVIIFSSNFFYYFYNKICRFLYGIIISCFFFYSNSSFYFIFYKILCYCKIRIYNENWFFFSYFWCFSFIILF